MEATVLTNFPNIIKTFGDNDNIFTIQQPDTTNQSGTFSYSASPDGIVSIADNNATIINAGTTTITATQSYQGYNYVSGLHYSKYNGYFADNPNWFNINTVTSTGTYTNVDVNNVPNNTSYQWIGFFKPNESGFWTFSTFSDDASYLWIGSYAESEYTTDNAVVNNGGTHSSQSFSNTISLDANIYYPIRIQYGNFGGPGQMSLSFKSPSSSNYVTDVSNFYFTQEVYNTTSSISATLTVDKALPVITIQPIPSFIYSNDISNNTVTINYTSTSDGAVIFTSSDTSVANVSGSTITFFKAGTATITAHQAETINYLSAITETTCIVVKALPVITIQENITKILGSKPFLLNSISTNTSETITYQCNSNDLISIDANGLVTIKWVGTSAITLSQNETENYFSVNKTINITIVHSTVENPVLIYTHNEFQYFLDSVSIFCKLMNSNIDISTFSFSITKIPKNMQNDPNISFLAKNIEVYNSQV